VTPASAGEVSKDQRLTAPDAVKVTVAILTFRRPDLLRRSLLGVLEQVNQVNQASRGAISGRVLVIDNDPAASGAPVVEELAEPLLDYVVETAPGIANARNRALAQCTERDVLVFVDDDEYPLPGWLRSLLSLWERSRPAAVGGKVVSDFEVEPGPWVAAGRYFERRSMPTGTLLTVCATNNLLLDLRQVRALGMTFDDTLGLGGGEDTLFTRQLSGRGLRLVWCEEAVVAEQVPAFRVAPRWVLARSWSHGNTMVTIALRLASSRRARGLARSRAMALGLIRVVAGSGRALLGLMSGRLEHQARGVRSLCRGGGMLTAALGLRYREYAGRRRTMSARRAQAALSESRIE
jgi:succinoglycan biosynthesis protein ExoM